jgi:excisionase family DNA binding protein
MRNNNKRSSDAELVPNGPLLLTLPELAAHLRVDRATVYRLFQRRELPIPILRLGRSPRVRSTDVEKYLAELAADGP